MALIAVAPRARNNGRVSFNRIVGALFLPSTIDIIFLILAFGVPFAFTSRLFGADGDIGRHIRVGQDILTSHGLFFKDQYSFTMAGQPFVPYEWLSEVAFAVAYRVGGLASVAVLTGLVIAATYTLVAVFIRRQGGDVSLALGTGVVSACVGLIHWLARPHIFTPLGAVLLLFLLEKPGRRTWWLTFPLFVAWVNLHGGFLYGLIMIGVYLFGDLVEARSLLTRQGRLDRAARHAGILALAIAGCCVNPVGPGLFTHVTGFLGDSYLVNHTLEYQSPDYHDIFTQIFLAALLLVVLVLAINPQRLSLPRLFLVFINIAFALYSVRNIPLFAVTVLPIVAVSADAWWRDQRWLGRLRSLLANGERDSLPGFWVVGATLILVAIALSHGVVGSKQSVSSSFQANVFPVAAVERARAAGLSGRMFNDFIWGGYILYAWPEQRVFIDGQSDFYGDVLVKAYQQVADLDPGWRDVLQKWDISLVIVRSDSALAAELARDPAWTTWYSDSTAVILKRTH